MDSAWPWLTIAGLGALHGLNPASGWPWAAACGWRHGGMAAVLRALGPLAIGHLVSVALLAAAALLSLGLPRELLQWLAAALLLAAFALHSAGRRIGRAPAGGVALGLWSFIVSTAHGAGLMLVPALAPLCLSGIPGGELAASGPLLLALAAVAVHTGAMLAAMACMSAGLQCMIDFIKRLREDAPAASSKLRLPAHFILADSHHGRSEEAEATHRLPQGWLGLGQGPDCRRRADRLLGMVSQGRYEDAIRPLRSGPAGGRVDDL